VAEAVLKVDKLTKDYGAYPAVDGVSFKIARGQVMGLLGPNGAGKSTTIQMLVGITLPTSGRIQYFGQDFARHRQACLQRINFASAYNTLQGRLTVYQNLLVFAGLYQVPEPKLKIAELLERFEIGRLAKHKYWDLSAGERARVNLAKALVSDPELILMDEPTASLDPDIADKTLSLIEDLRRERKLSILFTSHNMAEVERVCDEVIFLDRGHIVSQDTPSNHTKQLSGAVVELHYRGDREALEVVLKQKGFEYELGKGVVRVKTTAEEIAGLVVAVSKAGLDVRDVEVEKPTLEDVFLTIARRER
jgi:ABC-2 type transport system ATP-binding protein